MIIFVIFAVVLAAWGYIKLTVARVGEDSSNGMQEQAIGLNGALVARH